MTEILFKKESYRIIGACMEVHKELGCGFHELVYQEAAVLEFNSRNIPFEREKELDICYKGELLPKKFNADFVCFGSIIVEFKAASGLNEDHFSQVIAYLKASGIKLGLLINFGTASLKYRRIVY
jgi:GxxExxY protein